MRGAMALIPIWLSIAAAIAWAADSRPSPSVTVTGAVTDVHDGDTLTVEVRLPVRVRLLDCWAKELSQPGGKEAREHLRQLVQGKSCLVQIPLDGFRRSDDVFSFGRLLARVWIDGDSVDVSVRMVQDGHATKEKQR